ncbi:MAG: bifunctional metallophosphatase/5'-nucleotidase [Bacilli bacterium]|nr:bifunctional metallophosphatase/5'-nucleotidase [Bacilli bacterium]
MNKQRNLDDLSDDIVILHLNDVHCGINDTIGYDGFVLYREELKKKYKNILTVDIGDHIQGGTIGAISEGSEIIDILNKIGFDVAILGNHEFDYGVEQLLSLEKNITSRYICSNFCYRKNKTNIFDPYKIIEIGGKKIGFLAVLTPLTLTKTYLSTVKDSDGDKLYNFLPDEFHNKTQEYINILRNEKKVDYVILLTHLGMDIEQYTSNDLLLDLKNVDAVLDGHTHKVYNTTSKDKDGNNVNIAQTGTKLESIGVLILKQNNTISTENIKEVPEPSNTTNALKINRGGAERWVDKDMYTFIKNKWDKYDEFLNKNFGHSDFDLIIRPENSSDSHDIYCRVKECTLGNLIADGLKEAGDAEISIINGGGIRSNLYKGDINRKNIIDILPFYNGLVIKQLSGQTVMDALELGVSKYPNPSGGFLQVSGITFDFNPNISSTIKFSEDGEFESVTGERRVSNIKINGEDINLNRMYNACISDFIGNGGDGYTMLGNEDITGEILYSDSDSLSLFIENTLNGTIPEKYNKVEGRVNLVTAPINNTTESTTISSSTISSSTISSSTISSSTISSSTISSSNTSSRDGQNFFPKKSSTGLSTGGIIAIIIPCVAALIAATVIAFICINKQNANIQHVNQDSINSIIKIKNNNL